MTVVLPEPVPLPDPPGSPAALDGVIRGLTAAGFSAGLAVHLLEPAAVLVGWQGDDAQVAAREVAATTELTAVLHDALTTGATRLAAHHELWVRVAGRLAELREEQRAAFAVAGARLAAQLAGPLDAGLPSPPGASALVADLVVADADRGTEHAALLAALADDARAAVAALQAGIAAFVGGGSGPAALVPARLAARLPGWGAGELTRLAVDAAADLTRPGTVEQLIAAADRWTALAGVPGFAEVLVGRLGADGLRWALSVLGELAGTASGSPLAALLATALSTAVGGTAPAGPASEAVDGLRLDPDDPDGAVDQIAVGMGVVLAVPGAGAGLAAMWGRQVLEREDARGAGAVDRTTITHPDPVAAALTVLARAGDPAAAAELLASASAWRVLLERSWASGDAGLATVVELAADAGAAPEVAASLLQGLGRGLDPDQEPTVLRDVDRATLRLLAAPLGSLVAGQAGALAPALAAAGAGAPVDATAEAALRGLGLLVSEPAAGTAVTDAVTALLSAGAVGDPGEVAGAYVAVQEFGERITYALRYAQALSDATDWHLLWELARSPEHLMRGPAEERVGEVLDVVETLLHADGEVRIAPDAGRVRTADDAAAFIQQVPGLVNSPAPAADQAARAAFASATALLTRPVPPAPDPLDLIDEFSPPERERPRRRSPNRRCSR